jgi:ubiquinone/menaquinone biosynthesis C-methylase UbiE
VSDGAYYLDPALYDVVYSDIVADIEPYVALLRGGDTPSKAGSGPALELCCGNGRLLVPVREAGIACDGLDLDPRMLADLRERLAARSLSATLYEADMRDFSLPKRYVIITIPFNSFLHNLTQADQLRTLRCCRHHLDSGGRLVMNVFQPSLEKLLQGSDEQLFKQLSRDGGTVRIWDRTEDDHAEQLRHVNRRIEFLDAAGQRTREEHVSFSLRYIFKPEMELLLHVAGFSRWEARPLFTDHASTSRSGASLDRPVRAGDIVQWTAWKD